MEIKVWQIAWNKLTKDNLITSNVFLYHSTRHAISLIQLVFIHTKTQDERNW